MGAIKGALAKNMSGSVLVFGGAGYIGSHACKALAEAGFDPIVFDNLSEGHRSFAKWGELVEGDIRDLDAVRACIAAKRPIAAMHFAARSYVGESVQDPYSYYDNNVVGSINVARALKEAGGLPLVFSSTAAVYGEPDETPIPESAAKLPINPYGRTKWTIEQLLRDGHAAYGAPYVCLRYFNACGADPDCEVGEAHRNETHLIPRAILALLGRIDDFSIFGGDYATPDGSPIRDYIHVRDLADAHVKSLAYLLGGGAPVALNVGTGAGLSVFQIIEGLARIAGAPVPHSVGPKRAGDPEMLVADPSRAQAVLGFQAGCSDLDTILETAIEWHRGPGNFIYR